jgi:chemotaxis protein methyltransferase CheR
MDRLRRIVADRLGWSASSMSEARVRAMLAQVQTLDGLADLSLDDPAWRAILDALLIGETCFFRQAAWFSQLVAHAIRPLIEHRALHGPKRLRLWSAACATGEEAYTLAIVVDRLLPAERGWDVRIVGSDVSESFLDRAREAVYGAWALREVDPEIRARSFREIEPGLFELAPQLRDMVTFRMLNLAAPELPADEELSDVDLILCRNALMYLAPEHQRAVVRRLASRLTPDGTFAVAPAEASATLFRPLIPVSAPGAIFFRFASPGHPKGGGPAHPSRQPSHVPRSRRRAAATPVVPPAEAVRRPTLEGIRACADDGDLASARAQCEEFLRREGLDRDAHLLLGLICAEQDDAPAALAAARRAIYLDTTSAEAHYLYAASLQRLARFDQAQRQMEIVLRLLDNSASTPPFPWGQPREELRMLAAAYLANPTSDGKRAADGIVR